MSIVLPLSSKPAERLKEQADLGLFPWSDLDAARPMVEAACQDSDDNAEREAELILLALQENVAGAIRRALDRNPDVRMERCLGQVADYYGSLKSIASQVTPTEARWSVDTLAAIANLIPTSSVGAAASSTSSSSSSKSAPRPPSAPKSSSASPGPPAAPASAAPPQQPSWAAAQATSSAPPWAQAPMGAAAMPKVPVAMNATTSLPPPPGVGIAAGAGVALDRFASAPGQSQGQGQSWPPQAQPGYGRGLPGVDSGVPEEVDQGKWSWAGFLGGAFWMWAHKMRLGIPVWLGVSLLSRLLPLEMAVFVRPVFALALAIYLGLNGNRLGWDYRTYNSVGQFRTVQRIWIGSGVFIFLFFTAVYSFNIFAAFRYTANNQYTTPQGQPAISSH